MPQPMVLGRLRPYFGRIAVLDTPVDEEQRSSGIIVPFEMEEDVKRGVIIAIDVVEDDPSEDYINARLREGTVIYYRGGVQISDITFVQSSEIFAYEED